MIHCLGNYRRPIGRKGALTTGPGSMSLHGSSFAVEGIVLGTLKAARRLGVGATEGSSRNPSTLSAEEKSLGKHCVVCIAVG